MIRSLLSAFALSLLATAPMQAQSPFAGQVSDQALSALKTRDAGTPTHAQNWMVAAANPLAVEAGAAVLRKGGTAADAMIAVQSVLGLVEPQSSGLGGGAFLVWYDAASGTVTTLDGRETAPLAATPTLFQNENGEPLKFFDAVVGGRSVGTPATPALMAAAHKRWGKANWAGLFDRATSLAEEGFTVSPRLAASIAFDAERLSVHAATADYFVPNGVPLAAGDIRKNPAYAQTLRDMATHGADVFYAGELADSIINTVQTAPNPGLLSKTDLAIYRVKERPAVCAPYKGHQVCGMGPPSSGGLTVGQILKLSEPYNLGDLGPQNPEAWRIFGDASRLAFADRARYMADSDFVPVPTKGLLDQTYISSRAELLSGPNALKDVSAGTPNYDHGHLIIHADDASIEFPSTSHISIVDGFGNALSMTTTVENIFGSRLMAGGFILNNELTDFSFRSHRNGRPVANRVEPGKRPRSSMSPTIVLKDGKPVLVIGSPGGSRIIGFVAQTIVAHLDWGMDIQAAISMPRMVNRFGLYEIENGTSATSLQAPLDAMGFSTKLRDITSGLHGIAIGRTLTGGADPRREGIALGE